MLLIYPVCSNFSLSKAILRNLWKAPVMQAIIMIILKMFPVLQCVLTGFFQIYNHYVITATIKTNLENRDLLVLLLRKYVVRCAIWYHFYNLQNVKNTHGGVLILVELQVQPVLLKLTLLHETI